MFKYKIGDRFIRNDIELSIDLVAIFNSDPTKIEIISFSELSMGDTCNGYRIKDITTGLFDKDSYTEEYIDYYYSKDIRQERKIKINIINGDV